MSDPYEKTCPHLDYTDMLDGAKCNDCGLKSLVDWEDDEE